MDMTNQYKNLYPVEIAEILNAGEIVYDRSARGKAYFYLILDTKEDN